MLETVCLDYPNALKHVVENLESSVSRRGCLVSESVVAFLAQRRQHNEQKRNHEASENPDSQQEVQHQNVEGNRNGVVEEMRNEVLSVVQDHEVRRGCVYDLAL